MCVQDGYVHVVLRQYPHGAEEVKIELSVIDTGKVRCQRESLTIN